MRRTSGQIALVCALVAAGVATTPTWAKPGKNNAAGKSAAKATANKSAKKQAGKSDNAKTTAKASGKKTAGKSKSVASAKRSDTNSAKAAPAGKTGRKNKLAAESAVATHGKKQGKGMASKTPSAQDLRQQIAALQAKGKGKGRQLSKIQKQQLARLTAQAQLAEKAERQEKQEQARALRLAAAQKAKQRPATPSAPVAATLARNNQPVLVTQAVPQATISPSQQEDLLALQAPVVDGTNTLSPAAPTSAATLIAPSAAAVSAGPSADAGMAAQIAQASATPAVAATDSPALPAPSATQNADPLQALLDAKQTEFAAATAAATPATAAAVTTPVVAQAATVATVSTPAAPSAAVASATPVRKPESPSPIIRVSVPSRSSLGQIQGLSTPRGNFGPDLFSNVAFAMDQKTGQVLVNKNGHFVSPIASITKLMTAVITMDANLPMDEMITITEDDVDRLKGSRSRLAVGTTLSRQELLHLALMSSENRAAHALGRTYPGGLSEAIRAMNRRALMLGMRETRYVEPTGLSSANQSSAHDLAMLVKAAYRYPLIRNYTTYPGAEFAVQGQMMRFNNTNRLIHSPDWNIGLQKTGFISEAGRCVVMQSNINGRNVIIVLLDSSGTNRRVQDAEAIRYWVQNGGRQPMRDASNIIARSGSVNVY
ncbi:MAG: hypothetical protein Q4A11_01885 [Brachymonas sp.]|nr:hypothetical protein [Brachymonas sp.]